MKPTSRATVVRLYASLRELAGEREIALALPHGTTITDVLHRLVELRPSLADRLLDEDGSITRFANVFVNGRDIRYLSGLDTPVTPDDEVTILPPVAGGGRA